MMTKPHAPKRETGTPPDSIRKRGAIRAFALMFLGGIFVSLVASPVRANDVYLAQTALGGGSSCTAALAYSYFNTAGNWTTGTPTGTQIGPGTTVHLCGTIIAPSGASGYLTFHGSGLAGQPITLLFESGAVLEAPYWGVNGAINGNGQSYITVDGGTNGVVEATANGTALANQQNGKGIYCGGGCNNSEVKNLTISNLYVHAVNTSDENGQEVYGLQWSGSNVSVDHNTCHDAKWCLFISYPGSATSANQNLFDNAAYNADHDFVIGDGNTNGILNGALVYGNTGHDFGNWDDNNNSNHHDCIHVWATHNGSSITGLQVYNNYCYGGATYGIGTHMNAFVYLESNNGSTGTEPNCLAFNNLLVNSSTTIEPAFGYLGFFGTGCAAYNNTVVGGTNSVGGNCINTYSTGAIIENNICDDVATGIYAPSAGSIAVSDNNLFSALGSNAFRYGSTWYSSVASWSTSTGFDANSSTGSANLDSNYMPQSGSAAIDIGTNLSSLNDAALDSDKAGNSRPPVGSSTVWTAGAYQYGASIAGPTAPTGLAAIVN